MTGSFFNGSNKWTAFFVLNLVEFEWRILTEITEKMLVGESIDYIVIKSGD